MKSVPSRRPLIAAMRLPPPLPTSHSHFTREAFATTRSPNNTQQEALHGAGAPGGARASSGNGTGFGTSFPHALALAATLNRTLWAMVGRATAMESRAFANQGVGGLYLRTPNLNLARDARKYCLFAWTASRYAS